MKHNGNFSRNFSKCPALTVALYHPLLTRKTRRLRTHINMHVYLLWFIEYMCKLRNSVFNQKSHFWQLVTEFPLILFSVTQLGTFSSTLTAVLCLKITWICMTGSLILVAARSKASVCGRSTAEMVGSHPAGVRGCLFVVSVVCCQVEVCATGWQFIQSSTNCGASLCVS